MSEQLEDFLASPRRPEGTMDYHELCGFLFSVACSPELVMPSEWLPPIFDDQDPGYADLDQANSVLQQIMGLYNDINLQVSESRVRLPDSCRLTERSSENFAAPLGRWSRGFLGGHNWLSEVWESSAPRELDEELGSCLMILSYFADPALAAAYRREGAGGELDEEQMAQNVVEVFDEAMAGYALIGSTLYRALNNLSSDRQPVAREDKPGRNDPCPCGSGKKYKRCCLH